MPSRAAAAIRKNYLTNERTVTAAEDYGVPQSPKILMFVFLKNDTKQCCDVKDLDCTHSYWLSFGSFHTKSPKIQKSPSMTTSDFVEKIHKVTLNCFIQVCQVSNLLLR